MMMGQIFSRFFHVFSFMLLQNCQDEKHFAKASQVDKIESLKKEQVWIRITSAPKILGLNFDCDSELQPHQRSFSYTINTEFDMSISNYKMGVHSNVAAGKPFLL